MQAEEKAEDYPGRTTSVARAYGSVVANAINSTDVSSDELEEYQVCIQLSMYNSVNTASWAQ